VSGREPVDNTAGIQSEVPEDRSSRYDWPMVEVDPAQRDDAPAEPERPLLSAHPWRLPILLGLAFAGTIAIATVVLREGEQKALAQVSQPRKR
jgi:hypothetical protein